MSQSRAVAGAGVGVGAGASGWESRVPFPQEAPYQVRDMLCELVRARKRLVGPNRRPVVVPEVEHIVDSVAHDKLRPSICINQHRQKRTREAGTAVGRPFVVHTLSNLRYLKERKKRKK